MTIAKPLQNRNAIVTGGSRGIGKGIAHELASRGANILLTYHSSYAQAEEVTTHIKSTHAVDALAVQAQANDPAGPETIINTAVARWGSNSIDIIVNNAGAREDYAFEDMAYSAFDRQIAVNLRFPIFLVKAAVPHFGRSPRIINMSSIYARDGQPGCLAYVSSKGALESASRSLACELGHKYRATVNCVAPGPVNTELWQASIADDEERRKWEGIVRDTPAAPRVAEVGDVARVVAFLAEEGSGWVTGSLVCASGGLVFA